MIEVVNVHTVWILLLGISVIAMIVVHQAQQIGDWAMPQQVYAAMVFVSMTTCIGAPWILYRLLQHWPQVTKEQT